MSTPTITTDSGDFDDRDGHQQRLADVRRPVPPKPGTVVKVLDEVNAGVTFRAGTVVGHGEVHPAHFPYGTDLSVPGYPVALVAGPDGVVAWSLDRIEPAVCIFLTGHIRSCMVGVPQWTDPSTACQRSAQGQS